MTSKGSGSKKRYGRPGATTSGPKPSPRASDPASGPADARSQHRGGSAVKPASGGSADWSLATWLMLFSAVWSVVVIVKLAQSEFNAPDAQGGPPQLLFWLTLWGGLAAVAAFWRLRGGETRRARWLMGTAFGFGIFGVLSAVLALLAIVLVWRQDRATAAAVPTRSPRRSG